jgi:hypothetical protein
MEKANVYIKTSGDGRIPYMLHLMRQVVTSTRAKKLL